MAKSTKPAPALTRYREKRSADRTGEPFGSTPGPDEAPVGAPRLFVCQMHAARRLHWDLRLEIDGVLRSWAVPRGPSYDPRVKRLAVETEDHPIDYVDFEGVIPEGNYGAGAMIVWDRGVWTPIDPVGPGYTRGKLLFELHGHKLRGVWTLVRTKDADGKSWLLIKHADGLSTSSPQPLDQLSILSGLSIDEVRSGSDRHQNLRTTVQTHAPPSNRVSGPQLRPMLAQPRDEAFTKEGWLFELKYDGYRLIASRLHDDVQLTYRSGRDATTAFPEISKALARLPFPEFVLDGEVVVLDPDARPNFQRLQKRALLLRHRDIDRATREHPVTFYAFDLPAFDEFDLRGLSVLTRKTLLRELVPKTGPVRYADHILTHGEALMAKVRQLGVEGIVGKRSNSTYTTGRSHAWQKIRIERTDDFVIIGYRPAGKSSRPGFGALHLATHIDNTLTYVGRVGTGFSVAALGEIRALLDERLQDICAVDELPETVGAAVWVEPDLVCEVRYKQLTDERFLRHPVFLRLRDDKDPQACTIDDITDDTKQRESPTAPSTPPPRTPPPRTVVVSNPDKIFWPNDGYTKSDLVEFYRTVSPWLLPYLRDRPLVLTRYPDGIDGKSFFQKNAPPYVPKWVRTKTMWSEHAQREIEYFVCDDLDALVYIANMASIPLHVWGSRLATLQQPDWSILDLDPKGAPFEHVVLIARHIYELCEEIGLPCYAKTSGSTGLHVLIPLGGAFTFEQCRMLAEVLARVTASQLRDVATVERSMRARKGRVYIDFGQNGHGRLLVSPLCVRPLPGAPVSTPLRWDEVTPDLDHQAWTIRTVPARLDALGDPLAPVLETKPDLHQALAALLKRLD